MTEADTEAPSAPPEEAAPGEKVEVPEVRPHTFCDPNRFCHSRKPPWFRPACSAPYRRNNQDAAPEIAATSLSMHSGHIRCAARPGHAGRPIRSYCCSRSGSLQHTGMLAYMAFKVQSAFTQRLQHNCRTYSVLANQSSLPFDRSGSQRTIKERRKQRQCMRMTEQNSRKQQLCVLLSASHQAPHNQTATARDGAPVRRRESKSRSGHKNRVSSRFCHVSGASVGGRPQGGGDRAAARGGKVHDQGHR